MGRRKGWLAAVSETEKIDILEEVLGSFYREGASQLLFACPKCEHHKKKLSINVEKGLFKCWVCDWSGRNLYRIIRSYGNYQQKQIWRRFNQQVEVNDFAEKLFGETSNPDVKHKIELPCGFVSLANKSLPTSSKYPLNYLESRGLTKSDILKWKIGYTADGEYAGRVIVPSFDLDGDINYCIGRSYNNSWPKYKNPKAPKNMIFNHLYTDFDDDITIVEGVFDAIKAGYNSIPLLGSTLTEQSRLFKEIVQNSAPVYLALDSDAKKKADKIIKLLLKYDVEIYNIDVRPYGDVGEMTKKEFQRRKDSAGILTLDNYLINRIQDI